MYIDDLDEPESWRELNLDQLTGVVMIVGGSNTGKTTFSHYLYNEMIKKGKKVAYLDGDPGQSTLGPPTTMTIITAATSNETFDKGRILRKFVGSISPKGHMLQTLVGATQLVEGAKFHGAETILYDTTGLIDPLHGGIALKIAKINLLRPKTLIAFQREDELTQLLYPLRRVQHINTVVIEPSNQIKVRDKNARQEYRKRKYREYFKDKKEIEINWANIAVFPLPRFAINRLIAIENRMGFVDALGIITAINRDKRVIRVKSADISQGSISSIWLGDILVNPNTFEDRYI